MNERKSRASIRLELGDEDLLEEATKFKGKGNELFKSKQFEHAIQSYNEGLGCIDSLKKQPGDKTLHL